MDDVLQIALTPVQVAAVLSEKSVTESETLSNRLYGSLDLVLSSIELAGAASMCMVPEPTGLTKAACITVGAHSMDSIKTAIDRIITGLNTRTATYRAAVALAKRFGAEDGTAWKIGSTVDIAVPLGFSTALGAARVISVRAGRIRLNLHESATGLKPGGHTIRNHIGKSREELLARLTANKSLTAAGSFTNINVAERAITLALRANSARIKSWGYYPVRKLEIDFVTGYKVGSYIRMGSTELISTSKLRIVLEYKPYNGKPYYILTAFPIG